MLRQYSSQLLETLKERVVKESLSWLKQFRTSYAGVNNQDTSDASTITDGRSSADDFPQPTETQCMDVHLKSAQPQSLHFLPVEIILLISQELSVRSLVRIRMTCTWCRDVFAKRVIWFSALHDIAHLYSLPRLLHALPEMSDREIRETAMRIARIDHQFERVEPTFLHSLDTFAQPTISPGGRWIGLLDSTKRRWTLCPMASFAVTDNLIVPDLNMEIDILRIVPISEHGVIVCVCYFDEANYSTQCHLYRYCPDSGEREELKRFFLKAALHDCFIDDQHVVVMWQDGNDNQYAWISGHLANSPGVKMHLKGSTPYWQGSAVVCLDRSHLLLSNFEGVWLFPVPCLDTVLNNPDQACSRDVVAIRSCVPHFSIDWAAPLVAPFIPSPVDQDTSLVLLSGAYLQTLQPSRDTHTWDLQEVKFECGGIRNASLMTGASGILSGSTDCHLLMFKFATSDGRGLQRLECVFTRGVKTAYMTSTLQLQLKEHATFLSYDVESGTMAVISQPYRRSRHQIPHLVIVRL